MDNLRSLVLTACFSVLFGFLAIFPVAAIVLFFMGPAIPGAGVLFPLSVGFLLVLFAVYVVARHVFFLLTGKRIARLEHILMILILLGFGYSSLISISVQGYSWAGPAGLICTISVGLILYLSFQRKGFKSKSQLSAT